MSVSSSRKRPHGPDQRPTSDSSGSSNVKVVVRIRPPNVKEIEANFREVVQAVDENVLVFDPKESSAYDYGGRKRPRDIRKRANKDLKFAFDSVFSPSATNMDLYNDTTKTVLTGLLNGFNCSVFAYGATGAGKTFTMLGSKDQPGVMYHTMMDLYKRIEDVKETKTCDVAVSYLEIYNETIRDLLVPGASLPIREDPGKGVVVPGLSLHKPKSAEELLFMLQFGNQHRSQHPTDANAESSRSHAVFQVFVRQTDRTANISTEVRMAKLCLVDLAGSERATVTKNRGSRFREGANINRSLLALGNVINALAENKNKGYVPYRDSKLTRLLKDSLGGNCQTVMIAAVSPSAMSYEDTYNTLRYADRAKHIKAVLKKNVLNVDFHLAKYGQIVEELRKEIKELKGKLENYEAAGPGKEIVPIKQTARMVDTSAFAKLENELRRCFLGHQTLASDQLQAEISLRNLQWKMYRKARCLSRLTTLGEPCNVETVKNIDAMLSSMKQKTSCLQISSELSRSKIVESFKHLSDKEQEMMSSAGSCAPEMVSLSCRVHQLETELQNSKLHVSYTKQVVRCQERELQHNERLLHQVLGLLKQQHYIIKGHRLMTSDLADEYTAIQGRVGSQELIWEDQAGRGTQYVRGYTLAEMLDLPSLAIKQPAETGTADVKNSKNNNRVFEFTAAAPTETNKPAGDYPYTVDECSPPRAKRAMLSQQTSQSASRVKKHPYSHTQRLTPNKNHFRTKSNNSSSSNLLGTQSQARNASAGSSDKTTNGSCAVNAVSSRSKSNLNTSNRLNSEVDSPDENPAMTTKFSHVTDTVTKSKKFSNLHVKPEASGPKIEHDRLDDTFTIDPSVNPIPVSAIPHVDDSGDASDNGTASKECVCQGCGSARNKNSVIIKTNSRNSLCLKCAEHLPLQKHNSLQSPERVGRNSVGGHGHSHRFSVEKLKIDVDKPKNSPVVVDRSRSSHVVQPALNYSYCLDNPQSVPHVNSEGNDSGTSTIIDQSANSVGSLVSISTLVDRSNNLSQDLSGVESGDAVSEHDPCNKTAIEQLNSTVCTLTGLGTSSIGLSNGPLSNSTSSNSHIPHSLQHQATSASTTIGLSGSETVTKSSAANLLLGFATVTKSSNSTAPKLPNTADQMSNAVGLGNGGKPVNKAIRAIKFGSGGSNENTPTASPTEGKSFADVVQSPTPDRPPLRQLGNVNLNLSNLTPTIDSGRSSLTCSDNDSFDGRCSNGKMSMSRLFTGHDDSKENCRDPYNQFNTSAKAGLNRSKTEGKKGQCGPAPSYMQATKSHAYRAKLNSAKSTSNLNSSDDSSLGTRLIPNKMKSAFIMKNSRPLSNHLRSKSTSNLTTRAAWQF